MRTALPSSHQSNEVKAAYKTAMLSLITPEGCRDAPKKRKQLFRIAPKRSKEAAVVYVFTSVMTLGVLSWRFQPQAVMGDSQFRLEGEKNKERKGVQQNKAENTIENIHALTPFVATVGARARSCALFHNNIKNENDSHSNDSKNNLYFLASEAKRSTRQEP